MILSRKIRFDPCKKERERERDFEKNQVSKNDFRVYEKPDLLLKKKDFERKIHIHETNLLFAHTKNFNLTFNHFFWISKSAILWQRKVFFFFKKIRSAFNENIDQIWD